MPRNKIRLPEGDSEWIDTPNRIPQSSLLSPILYLFYNAPCLEIDSQEEDDLKLGYIDEIGVLVVGLNAEEGNHKR